MEQGDRMVTLDRSLVTPNTEVVYMNTRLVLDYTTVQAKKIACHIAILYLTQVMGLEKEHGDRPSEPTCVDRCKRLLMKDLDDVATCSCGLRLEESSLSINPIEYRDIEGAKYNIEQG